MMVDTPERSDAGAPQIYKVSSASSLSKEGLAFYEGHLAPRLSTFT